MCKVGECLVHCFARSADELGELFLRKAVRDHDAFIALAAEALSEVEEVLRDTAGNVREHEIRERIVGLAQAACERSEEVAGYLGALGEHTVEVLLRERVEGRLGNGGCRGVTRCRIEKRKLAESFARAEHSEKVLATVAGGVTDLNLAARDDKEAVALVTLAEHDRAAVEVLLSHRSEDSLLAVVIERGE